MTKKINYCFKLLFKVLLIYFHKDYLKHKATKTMIKNVRKLFTSFVVCFKVFSYFDHIYLSINSSPVKLEKLFSKIVFRLENITKTR